MQLNPLGLKYEAIRGLVLEALSTAHQSQVTTICSRVAELAIEHKLVSKGSQPFAYGETHHLSKSDHVLVTEILWDLVIEGVIRPGLDAHNSWPTLHVTQHGKEILAGVSQSPYDPDGYLKRLEQAIPDLDPVIKLYLEESLTTFRLGRTISAAVALGVASEKAFSLVIEAYGASIASPQKKAAFKKDTDGQSVARQWKEFHKQLIGHLQALLPTDTRDNLDVYLGGIFNLIRQTRNEAGHPTGTTIPLEVTYAQLLVFPLYLRKMYDLIAWLKSSVSS